MAAVPFSDLYPEILPSVPQCPLPMVDRAILNAAIEFCAFSDVMQVDLPDFVTVADQKVYDLIYDTANDVTNLVSGRCETWEIYPISTTELAARGAYEAITGAPVRFWHPTPDTIRLYPIPNDVYSLNNLRAAIRPKANATTIDDFLTTKYREAIASGVLSRLLSMGNQPWTDKETAREKKLDFEDAKGSARIEALKNFSTADLFVKPRKFGG